MSYPPPISSGGLMFIRFRLRKDISEATNEEFPHSGKALLVK
jgi:hypothetical protein